MKNDGNNDADCNKEEKKDEKFSRFLHGLVFSCFFTYPANRRMMRE